jgi:putative transposase
VSALRERGLDPKVCRLFIIDGAKAVSKVIRRTFGAHTPIQRCQIHIHKARNVSLHASVRLALRQAWELDDADKAERLLRNLARRLDQEAPGFAASKARLRRGASFARRGMPVKRLGGGHCGDRSVAAMAICYRRAFTCAPALPT